MECILSSSLVPVSYTHLIMITTTAGSGAEITQFISITDTVNKTKAQIGSPLCIPPVAVLCPEMLKNSPETVTAAVSYTHLDAAVNYAFPAITVYMHPVHHNIFYQSASGAYDQCRPG